MCMHSLRIAVVWMALSLKPRCQLRECSQFPLQCDFQADEMLRRNKDRDERLKVLQAEAATFSAETKRLEQQRAQLEAELAEAHRERWYNFDSLICLVLRCNAVQDM